MTDTFFPTHTFRSVATLHSGGVGVEENSDEGLIEPIGSEWLVTDSISSPSRSGGVRVTANLRVSNQAAEATRHDPLML